jgi:hypothetical protein
MDQTKAAKLYNDLLKRGAPLAAAGIAFDANLDVTYIYAALDAAAAKYFLHDDGKFVGITGIVHDTLRDITVAADKLLPMQ